MASLVAAEPTLLTRVAGMLLHPHREWAIVAAEDSDARNIFMRYALPLIATVTVGGFIGAAVYGPNVLGIPLALGTAETIVGVLVSFVLMVVTYHAMVMLSDSVVAKLGSEATFTQSFKLVTYSCTPTWLILAVVAMVPPLRFLMVGVFWTTWLAWIGTHVVMGMQGRQAVRYLVTLLIGSAVLYSLLLFLILMQFNVLRSMGIIA
ncbi:MAG TPA: Yip1 family protein [Burkholderiaceae bacterium]|nr:Yip1 family protein [Burkholderiaceae bacterium]